MTQTLPPPSVARSEPPLSDAHRDEDWLDPIDRALNDDNGLEYVDGQLIEKNVSEKPSFVGSMSVTHLNAAAASGGSANVCGEAAARAAKFAEYGTSRSSLRGIAVIGRWEGCVATPHAPAVGSRRGFPLLIGNAPGRLGPE